MVTFIKRAEKRYNFISADGNIVIEVSFHYGHFKYMYELYHLTKKSVGYHFDTFIDAMDEVCGLIGEDYRIMDEVDLELEKTLLE